VHREALEKGRQAVTALGEGLDIACPTRHCDLLAQALEAGLACPSVTLELVGLCGRWLGHYLLRREGN